MDQDLKDLFSSPEVEVASSPKEHKVPPSESVYIDLGLAELAYIGEVQLPRPLPVELVIEVDGWDYVYKLDRRAKSEAA